MTTTSPTAARDVVTVRRNDIEDALRDADLAYQHLVQAGILPPDCGTSYRNRLRAALAETGPAPDDDLRQQYAAAMLDHNYEAAPTDSGARVNTPSEELASNLLQRIADALISEFKRTVVGCEHANMISFGALADSALAVVDDEMQRLCGLLSATERMHQVRRARLVQVRDDAYEQAARPIADEVGRGIWEQAQRTLQIINEGGPIPPDETDQLRAEVRQMTLAYNGANAMSGVHKRQADRLRTELEHAKAALAGDNQAVGLFMIAPHELTGTSCHSFDLDEVED